LILIYFRFKNYFKGDIMKGLRKSGFTMIELVIVIIIMGVMAFTAYKALMGSSDKSKIGSGLIKDEVGQIRLNATDIRESTTFNDFRFMDDEAYRALYPSNYGTEFVTNTGASGVGGYGLLNANAQYLVKFVDDNITDVDTTSVADTTTLFTDNNETDAIIDKSEYGGTPNVTAANATGNAIKIRTKVVNGTGNGETHSILSFRSQAMPDCFLFTANQISYRAELQRNTTYAILIDCSKSQSVQVKKVMEAKARAWFNKNFDNAAVQQGAIALDAAGTMYNMGTVANYRESAIPDATWGNNSDGIFGASRLVQ
jgi:prepilin-type N-terminal cleavage/methylation domain-containing protein